MIAFPPVPTTGQVSYQTRCDPVLFSKEGRSASASMPPTVWKLTCPVVGTRVVEPFSATRFAPPNAESRERTVSSLFSARRGWAHSNELMLRTVQAGGGGIRFTEHRAHGRARGSVQGCTCSGPETVYRYPQPSYSPSRFCT